MNVIEVDENNSKLFCRWSFLLRFTSVGSLGLIMKSFMTLLISTSQQMKRKRQKELIIRAQLGEFSFYVTSYLSFQPTVRE
ncbi:hypothetical protein CSUI_002289 [Cystoisospora suis]|uniref:Transmembrane protein n=1 Tax=Cystoisospora suis TaxID=483139 RepID=A0A2C6L9K8_9APIC|nr:hypothetical protein CSUI_002289 [Cystoisospora suis]